MASARQTANRVPQEANIKERVKSIQSCYEQTAMFNLSSSSLFILIALFSICLYRYNRNTPLSYREVNTTPYTSLEVDTKSKLEIFKQNDFDPRRYPIEVLNYISKENNQVHGVPFSWENAVDLHNKTDLGRHWMSQYTVNQVCLMNDMKILEYDTIKTALPAITEQSQDVSDTIAGFFDTIPLTHPYSYKTIELSTDDFQLNFSNNINDLPKNQRESLESQSDFPEYRYFKEASLLSNPSNGLSHYDLRFFHSKIPAMDRVSILHRVARSWARFTNSHNITTWLAHGSLMGYYFNGLILPWDDDLDVQVSATSFWDLVKMNGTMVIDYQDGVDIGMYLIDINPFFYKRERNPDNKIDARFIDIRSGLYIDITVLANDINDTEILQSLGGRQRDEFFKLFDPQYDLILTETQLHESKMSKRINITAHSQSLISCKDYHFYTAEELSPLIPTIFEGEVLYVPNNIEYLLLREYGRKSIYFMEFHDSEFDKFDSLWKSKIYDYEVNKQILNFTTFHFDSLKQSTNFKRHVWNEEDLIRFDSFRVDPWIRDSLS